MRASTKKVHKTLDLFNLLPSLLTAEKKIRIGNGKTNRRMINHNSAMIHRAAAAACYCGQILDLSFKGGSSGSLWLYFWYVVTLIFISSGARIFSSS